MSDTENTQAPQTINPNFDKKVDFDTFKFRFRKDKLGNQRPNIEFKGPVPSVEGFVDILEKGGKGLEFLKEVAYNAVRDAMLAYIADNESATADNIPLEKFTWEAIANQPREDRRASQFTEADWEAFAKDYIEVMPAATNKTVENVTNATVVYLKKFSIVKTNKEVLSKLKDQLGLYLEHSKNAEQHAEIVEFLLKKADTYLKSDDVELLVNNL